MICAVPVLAATRTRAVSRKNALAVPSVQTACKQARTSRRADREAMDEAMVRLSNSSSTRSPRRSSRTSTGEIIFPSLAMAL